MAHALVVDDDADLARMLAALVVAEGHTVATARLLADARRQMAVRQPDIVLLDLHLPDGSGMELLEDEHLAADSEIVLMTGQATLETSIRALRLGAADYLVKPVSATHLRGVLSRFTPPATLRAELSSVHKEWERNGRFGHLVGRSAAMRKTYDEIARVAATSVTVLLAGESGTGKELVARTLHDLSRRRGLPFLGVNCGAISPQLMESEIFGHEKGSFTGAERQHLGFFERARGGTLFLDEITEMPLELQVKLLRVLESGSFMRVGSTEPQAADVRIIAATNRVPEEAVASKALREDLYYRLNVFPIDLAPLRRRLDDIPLLTGHFLAEIGAREGTPKRASRAALERLAQYRWPGNVRELRNVLQRAYLMTEGAEITDEWLPRNLHAAPASGAGQPQSREDDRDCLRVPLGTSLPEVERQLILATLQHCSHQKERTAATLGISMKTLYNKLKEYSARGSA